RLRRGAQSFGWLTSPIRSKTPSRTMNHRTKSSTWIPPTTSPLRRHSAKSGPPEEISNAVEEEEHCPGGNRCRTAVRVFGTGGRPVGRAFVQSRSRVEQRLDD